MSLAKILEHVRRDSLTEEERKNGYIFNLGHGISQYTSPENVAILVDTIREY